MNTQIFNASPRTRSNIPNFRVVEVTKKLTACGHSNLMLQNYTPYFWNLS